jgi:hypothetical protein
MKNVKSGVQKTIDILINARDELTSMLQTSSDPSLALPDHSSTAASDRVFCSSFNQFMETDYCSSKHHSDACTNLIATGFFSTNASRIAKRNWNFWRVHLFYSAQQRLSKVVTQHIACRSTYHCMKSSASPTGHRQTC